MERSVPIAEAKARLSEYIRAVESGEAVTITRHGRAVAALVSPQDLEHLERLRRAGPAGGLASLAGGWEGSLELVHQLQGIERSSTRTASELE